MPLTSPSRITDETLANLDKILLQIDSDQFGIDLTCACSALVHRETTIQVVVPVDQIVRAGSSYNLIEGRVVLEAKEHQGFKYELPCAVASGNWHRLRNMSGEKIDLVANFDRLLPQGSGIGLVTCQNGIQNSEEDFRTMCNAVANKLTSKSVGIGKSPLLIGIYNRTTAKGIGIYHDLKRLLESWTLNHYSILALRQMFATFGLLFRQIRPQLRWVHVAHSEGGLFANRCFTNREWGLTDKQREAVQKHLITLVYGGVGSVPDSAVLFAINTYSTKDIALRFAKPYLDKLPRPDTAIEDRRINAVCKMVGNGKELARKRMQERDALYDRLYIDKYSHESTKNGHTVTIVECITKNPPFVEGDHAFMGDTYQLALEENFKRLNKKWGIVS